MNESPHIDSQRRIVIEFEKLNVVPSWKSRIGGNIIFSWDAGFNTVKKEMKKNKQKELNENQKKKKGYHH